MNGTKCLTNKVGWVLCTLLGWVLVWVLAGTYAAEISVGVAIHTESDFYEPLTPYGEWVVVGSYGRCWRPARVEADWRPYCNGSWQRTDDGWYWVSDEPWGWATYHYGRWDMNDEFGWYWVPQTVWAPAWVSWHEGGGYIGWAPLSPSGRVDVTVISPRIVFVEQRHFLEPVHRTTVVVNNSTIINKTVINKGPQTAVIEKVTGHKIQPVQVRELRHKEEAAVVIKQWTPTATGEKQEKNVQTPARNETDPREKGAAPAKEQRQVEKPAVTPNAPESPTPKKAAQDLGEQKPATQYVRPGEESRARKEVKPEPKPGTVQPSKHDAKPEAKPEAKSEVKPEPKPESKKEANPEGEKRGQKQEKPDKGSEKKGEEEQTP